METKPIPSTGLEVGKTYVDRTNSKVKIYRRDDRTGMFYAGGTSYHPTGAFSKIEKSVYDLIIEVIEELKAPDEIWVNVYSENLDAYRTEQTALDNSVSISSPTSVHYIRADSVADVSKLKDLLKKARAQMWITSDDYTTEHDFLLLPLIKEIDIVLGEKK